MAEDQGYVIKKVGFTISPPLRVCHHQHPSWCLPHAQIVLINCVYCMFDRSETEAGFQMFSSLVSTYVVCERLFVMHEPAGVVEILVQILLEYPLFWSTVLEYPPSRKWKLSESPNPRVSEYPLPQNENCQRVQIREFQNTPPPQNENCQRVQIWEFQNTPPQKWKLSESPNLRVSEYPPPNENCQRVQIREFQNTPSPRKWKLSESPNLRVSEYPPKNENCQRVQIWEFQNTPPKWKLSESPNLRVSEYPPPKKSEKLQISNFRIV